VDRLVDRDLAEAFPLEVFADAVGLFAEASDVARAVLFVAQRRRIIYDWIGDRHRRED